MKRIVQTIVLLLTINTTAMAQKGFEVQKEIIINVSASELWELIGPGFVDVYKWSSNIDHASGSGTSEFKGAVCSKRSCDVNVKGFSKINETLIKYDESKMVLAYQVYEGMPGFVTKAVNEWSVVTLGNNKSKLVMDAEFGSKGIMGTLMNGMMKKKMNETLETVLNDAKIYLETGKVSMIKAERVEAIKKKQKA